MAPKSASFKTALSSFGNNTGIEVPAAVIEKLGAGARPGVIVDLNGFEFRTTVGVMGGRHLVSVSAAVRKETGLRGGDPITVKLTIADAPRPVELPPDFAAALRAHRGTRAFFDGLSNSLQRYHIDNINGAKNPDTRKRRVDKAVSLFASGKQR